jgi:regulator of replication initiation timing
VEAHREIIDALDTLESQLEDQNDPKAAFADRREFLVTFNEHLRLFARKLRGHLSEMSLTSLSKYRLGEVDLHLEYLA